jgi:hypothetical protein
MKDVHRRWYLIWISGPANAGKSAIAQSFAEECLELKQLGASFFFPKKQLGPADGLIATIAYRLAVQLDEYLALITPTLIRDPGILDQKISDQFLKLIVEPFSALSSKFASAPAVIPKPLVIVIDGLDHYNNEHAQREFVGAIGEHLDQLKAPPIPLLWIISSRPESHLKHIFTQTNPPIRHHQERITHHASKFKRLPPVVRKRQLSPAPTDPLPIIA